MVDKPEHRYALIWACTKCLAWPLLSVMPARICLIGFNYAQPFLISRMISFVSVPQNSSEYRNRSLGLIAAAALIYVGVAVSTVVYMRQLYRSITMLRGSLVGLVFNKSLILRDSVYDESAAVTLMSTDIDRIALSMQNMHEVWARLVEVAIGIWLLSIKLGAVSVIPVIVVIGECGLIRTHRTNFLTYSFSVRCYQHSSFEDCQQQTDDLERSYTNSYRLYCLGVRVNEKCKDDGSGRAVLSEYPNPASKRDELCSWLPLDGSVHEYGRLCPANIRSCLDLCRIRSKSSDTGLKQSLYQSGDHISRGYYSIDLACINLIDCDSGDSCSYRLF
jgi:hypothetical protein